MNVYVCAAPPFCISLVSLIRLPRAKCDSARCALNGVVKVKFWGEGKGEWKEGEYGSILGSE